MAAVDDDPVFQQGLESILAPLRANGASQAELDSVTAQARSFYQQQQQQQQQQAPSQDQVTSIEPSSATPDAAPEPQSTATAKAAGQAEEPPYPSSFASLAALIASGQPIPGIKEIPDKLAEGEPSESKVDPQEQGKKPWERSSSLTTGSSDTAQE